MRFSFSKVKMRFFAAFLLVFLSYFVCASELNNPTLYIKNENGEIVFKRALEKNGVFGIVFTHSVAKTPVYEWFYQTDQKVALSHTIYQDFGAGLPHEIASPQTMTIENGFIRIDGFTLQMDVLPIRVGRIANHQLLLPTNAKNAPEKIALDTLAKAGSALFLSYQ